MRLISWASTDVGLVRMDNEDSYFIDDSMGLYLVADGMGGHAGGAHASATCTDVVNRTVRRGLMQLSNHEADALHQEICELLAASVGEASMRIFNQSIENSNLQGMGTTLTGMLFYGDFAYIVHVGDSRAYMLRSGEVQQLTSDHTWINEQIQAGLLTDAEAELSDLKHIITRSVGFEPTVEVDIIPVNFNLGDAFVLCSDGLSNHVTSEELKLLAKRHYYQELPTLCTQLALERGGDDNITVVTILVGNDQERVPSSRQWQKTAANPIT